MTEYLACLTLGVVIGLALARSGQSEHERSVRSKLDAVIEILEEKGE
jgi:hypothetical protein